jgi:hypothetical protein
MRVPRVRFKVWSMMVAVLVVALSFGYLRRPYPVTTTLVLTEVKNSIQYIDIKSRWSDGRVQHIAAQCLKDGVIYRDLKASEPWPRDRGRLGPLLRIDWSDGSTSYYLDGR